MRVKSYVYCETKGFIANQQQVWAEPKYWPSHFLYIKWNEMIYHVVDILFLPCNNSASATNWSSIIMSTDPSPHPHIQIAEHNPDPYTYSTEPIAPVAVASKVCKSRSTSLERAGEITKKVCSPAYTRLTRTGLVV